MLRFYVGLTVIGLTCSAWRSGIPGQRPSALDAEIGTAATLRTRPACYAFGFATGKIDERFAPRTHALCGSCFLLMPISLHGLAYSVRRAKQESTLTHY